MSDIALAVEHVQNYVLDLYKRQERAASHVKAAQYSVEQATAKAESVDAKLASAAALLEQVGAEVPSKPEPVSVWDEDSVWDDDSEDDGTAAVLVTLTDEG